MLQSLTFEEPAETNFCTFLSRFFVSEGSVTFAFILQHTLTSLLICILVFTEDNPLTSGRHLAIVGCSFEVIRIRLDSKLFIMLFVGLWSNYDYVNTIIISTFLN